MIGAAVGICVGQPLWWTLQHQLRFSGAQDDSASTAQLKGSPLGTGRIGRTVGGGVGAGVGNGVGGTVGDV